jgi:hypothetical protein
MPPPHPEETLSSESNVDTTALTTCDVTSLRVTQVEFE